MKRLATLSAALMLLAACTTGSPGSSASTSPGVGLLNAAGQSTPGATCPREAEPCDNTRRCCLGSSCVPWGKFGSLCRTPSPS